MIETPKMVSISLTMAQAAKTMAKPMRALVIWLRALATFFSSPPDITHLRPPRTSMKKKMRATTNMTKEIAPETILETVRSFNPEKLSVASRLILSAA